MKKIISISIFLFAVQLANAQIKVHSGTPAKVSIGSTSTPLSALDITGGLAIGSYASTNAAPTNGLIVSGKIGFGTTSPQYQTQISGTLNAGYILLGDNANGSNNTIEFVTTPGGTTYGSGYINFYGSGLLNLCKGGGNVGIGNLTASYKLDVGGGDINVASSGNGYRIQGNKVLSFNSTITSNIFVGVGAGNAISSGTYNTFLGYRAGYTTNSGTYNTANGYQSLLSNTTGTQNTSTGANALSSNAGGGYNSAYGVNSLLNNVSGNYNTAIGTQSLYYSTSSNNTAAGYYALISTTSGSGNTGHGTNAGSTITTGSNNTCVGYSTNVAAACSTLSNMSAVGYNTVVTAANKIFLGDANVSGCYNYANVWAGQSDQRIKFNVKEEVKGWDFIKRLRPVTYQMDSKKATEITTANLPDSVRNKYFDSVDFTASESKIHSGFIAQEVEQAIKNSGFSSTTIVIPPSNDNDLYALNYVELVVPLVKAVQEQQQIIDNLILELNAIKAKVVLLENK